MNTYIVHFVGKTGVSFKVGEYKSKKAIRRAKDRYDIEYGSYLGLKIINKDTLSEVQCTRWPNMTPTTEKVLSINIQNISAEDLAWLHELKNRAAVMSGRLQLKHLKASWELNNKGEHSND